MRPRGYKFEMGLEGPGEGAWIRITARENGAETLGKRLHLPENINLRLLQTLCLSLGSGCGARVSKGSAKPTVAGEANSAELYKLESGQNRRTYSTGDLHGQVRSFVMAFVVLTKTRQLMMCSPRLGHHAPSHLGTGDARKELRRIVRYHSSNIVRDSCRSGCCSYGQQLLPGVVCTST